MDSHTIKDWATAYIALQQDSDRSLDGHPLFWAAERFMFPGDSASVEDCWAAILEVLSRNPPELVVGVLAAGPLEDLIDRYGPEFIERIELQARRDPAFRHLLGGVWTSSTPSIWARVEAARGVAW
ncbi:DUF6869 domain-containing protein [Xanthomonas maliensis]|uniref:DUF6869 domain-containing protein n=1 Tax=Xanthomonas maliensis TaxID=1321368 RepID=UPI001264230C|nr:hypothetical protein [Xanthomonas maliensis]KAB7768787.1 hypothetical protein CKY51_08445 [Xanthomonas maliensis]